MTDAERRKRRARSNVPVTIRYGLPLAVIAFLIALWFEYGRTRVARLQIVADGSVVPRVLLEFFEFDDGPNAASPTRKVGEYLLDGEASVALGPDLVPGEALVRITAPDFGVGFGHVELGDRVQPLELSAATRVSGRVVDEAGTGLRDAKVLAFGGGKHGVLLREAVTDQHGHFEIAGLAKRLEYVHLRTLCRGRAVDSRDVWFAAPEPPCISLARSTPIAGRLVLPSELTEHIADLRVRVYNQSGIEAVIAPDGTFVIDHLSESHWRLFVASLPVGWTHRGVDIATDRAIEMRVTRAGRVTGRVVDANDGKGIAGATVLHDHGPGGREAVRCDLGGNFTLERVPEGAVFLRAIAQSVSRTGGTVQHVAKTGTRLVRLEAGEHLAGIAVEVQ